MTFKEFLKNKSFMNFMIENPKYNIVPSAPSYKVEKIQEDSLDSIPSSSPSVKIQIIGWKFT